MRALNPPTQQRRQREGTDEATGTSALVCSVIWALAFGLVIVMGPMTPPLQTTSARFFASHFRDPEDAFSGVVTALTTKKGR